MDVFFYGLFMDERRLVRLGVAPSIARLAQLPGYRLEIARRATLVEEPGARTWGVVIELSPDDVRRLYAEPSVSDYRPVVVHARFGDGSERRATCYVLPEGSSPAGGGADYARELGELARELGLPDDYVAEIRRAGERGPGR